MLFMQRDNDACNRQMICLRKEIAGMEHADDDLVKEEGDKAQRKMDEKRCAYLLWSQKTNRVSGGL